METIKNNRRNLKKIWKQLDDACGLLENAFYNINDMEEMSDLIKQETEYVDISAIVSLKNKIEILIDGQIV